MTVVRTYFIMLLVVGVTALVLRCITQEVAGGPGEPTILFTYKLKVPAVQVSCIV